MLAKIKLSAKQLIAVLLSVGIIAPVIAMPMKNIASAPTVIPPQQNEACVTGVTQLRNNHKEVEKAIEANDVNKVGTLVIANQKFAKDFFAKNPECKPHGFPMGNPQAKTQSTN